VRVVFPESMCALIPMFRIRLRSVIICFSSSFPWVAARRLCEGAVPEAGETTSPARSVPLGGETVHDG
jgi:hypothetical protein